MISHYKDAYKPISMMEFQGFDSVAQTVRFLIAPLTHRL